MTTKALTKATKPTIELAIQKLARDYTTRALKVLMDIIENGGTDAPRVVAAKAILAYGWGTPRGSDDMYCGSSNGQPQGITIVIEGADGAQRKVSVSRGPETIDIG